MNKAFKWFGIRGVLEQQVFVALFSNYILPLAGVDHNLSEGRNSDSERSIYRLTYE